MKRLALAILASIIFTSNLLAQPVNTNVSTIPSFAIIRAPNGTISLPSWSFQSQPSLGCYRAAVSDLRCATGGVDMIRFVSNQVILPVAGLLSWGSSGVSSVDVSVARFGANILIQRNGTNPQAFKFANTFTDTSNYEALEFIATSAAASVIGQRNVGTGVARNLIIRGNIANGTGLLFDAVNNWVAPETDNTTDLGTNTGPKRFKLGWFVSTVTMGTLNFTGSGGSFTIPTRLSMAGNGADGTALITNAGGTIGVSFDVATDGTLKVLTRGSANTATVSVGTLATNQISIGNTLCGNTNTTVSSGFGTSPSITSNGNCAFRITIGNPTAATGVLNMNSTAANGWSVHCADVTTNTATVFLTRQTTSSTTQVTLVNLDAAGASQNWVAGDQLACQASAF